MARMNLVAPSNPQKAQGAGPDEVNNENAAGDTDEARWARMKQDVPVRGRQRRCSRSAAEVANEDIASRRPLEVAGEEVGCKRRLVEQRSAN
jgi:hypothetical protein